MVKKLDKSKLAQDKQMQKQTERLKAEGMGLQVTGKKIKGESDKDLARVKAIDKARAAEEKSRKRARVQSTKARLGMADDFPEQQKAIRKHFKESEERQKKLDEKMKLRRQQNKERMDELKKRYQQPRPIFGSPKGEFTIKGGAGPRGKQLKRI